MGLAKLVMGGLTACPPLGRFLLRSYLRAGGAIPPRAMWAVLELQRRLVPDPSVVRMRLYKKLVVEVDLATAMGRGFYYNGTCEAEIASFLKQTLKPGMTFVDVGANFGEFTLLGSALVGPRGRVFSFECSPTTLPSLRRNLELNRPSNVTVVAAALSDTDGHVTFYPGSEKDSGSSSLTPPHDHKGQTVTVESMTLDSLARREKLDRVDVIKMDVEGAEWAALRGAAGLLGSPDPPVLVFEYNEVIARRSGWQLDDVKDLLERHNYKLHSLHKQRLTEFDHRWSNVVAMPGARA